MKATDSLAKAGIYLTNGNQKVMARLYSTYDNGNKLVLHCDTSFRIIPNTFGKTVWLKIERNGHELSGYYSHNGKTWTSFGLPVNTKNLDKTQPNYNSWVGTSIGLFAENTMADFDFFICKDGYSPLPAYSYSNYYGIHTVNENSWKYVTTTTENGGWFMLSGVEMGKKSPKEIEITFSAETKSSIEIWADDLGTGKRLAVIPIPVTGKKNRQIIRKATSTFTGHHDLYFRIMPGTPASVKISSVRFIQ